MTKIAVIGAGLAGLVIARRLGGSANVTVFEKSRGVGGRMATRYAGDFEFDHGAQFFKARTPAFKSFLEPLLDAGVVANWPARFAELRRGTIGTTRQWDNSYPHYVGTPRMNAVGKFLAAAVDVRLGERVSHIEKTREGWKLHGESCREPGHYDWVVLTAPAAQTAALGAAAADLVAVCEATAMRACFALLLGFDEPLRLDWQAALVRNADISWISVNSSKPGRARPPTLVAHSTNAWADAHIDGDPEIVKRHLTQALQETTGLEMSSVVCCDLHRWRYANLDRRRGPKFFVDADAGLAACGDWFVRGRVEAAFTSADALANALEPLLAS